MCFPTLILSAAICQFGPAESLTSTATYPNELALVDLDGDGDDDLIVLASGENRLVLFEKLAPGSFGRGRELVPVGWSTYDLASGDLDGDGDVDFVIAGPQDEGPRIVENLGAGVFGPPRPLGNVVGSTVELFAHDVDQDSDLDIVSLTTGPGGTIALHRNLGGLQFAPPIDPAGLSTRWYAHAELEDFTGDGLVDLVHLDEQNHLNIQVGSGTGSFGPPTLISAGPNLVALASGDVDGDGDQDLVSSRFQQADTGVFSNLGSGSFSGFTPLPGAGGYGRDAWTGDFDADGDDDIFVTLNNGNVVFQQHESLGGGSFHPPVTVLTGRFAHVNEIARALVDGDGIFDLLYISDQGAAESATGWARGTASSGAPFDPPVEITAGVSDVSRVRPVDLDGDGDLDLLASGGSRDQWFMENRAPGSFELPLPLSVNMLIGAPADYDGDGLADLVGSESIGFRPIARRNLGGLQFGPPVVLADRRGFVASGDFDGDSDPDLAYRVFGSALGSLKLAWFENVGGFQFGTPQLVDPVERSVVSDIVADLDDDGFDDLVSSWSTPGAWQLGWYRGSSQGLQPLVTIDSMVGLTAVVDLDGDGILDIVGRNQNSGLTFDWWRGLGAGALAPRAPLGMPTPQFIEEFEDIDGDGVVDVVFRTGLGTRSWSQGLGGGAFSSVVESLTVLVNRAQFFDIDLDGDRDLVASNTADDTVLLYRNLRLREVGQSYCANAIPNSTGALGRINAVGSLEASANVLTLRASQLPQSTFGYFLASRCAGDVFPVPSSAGRLCLCGPIGRFSAPGLIGQSGSDGFFDLRLDLTAVPTPTGFVALSAGERWYFQAWHRDSVAGQATSNFTDGVDVLLQ